MKKRKRIIMKRAAEFGCVFTTGGLIYALVEILFRGYTHWSMFILGGLCFIGMYVSAASHEPIWKKWVISTGIILVLEFEAGIILNLLLGWDIWDYSKYRFNLYGQICLRYALCWFALCIPGNALCDLLRTKLFERIRS